MKKVTRGVQRLSQRAVEIRQVVESLPAKASELRETVAATVGQAQQIRAGLEAGVSTIRAHVGGDAAGDAGLAATMREIEGAEDVLAEAGYRLAGVDVELGGTLASGGIGLGPGRRVLVRLVRLGRPGRLEAVGAGELRALLAAHKDRPVLRSLLAALVQVAEVAGTVELNTLRHAEVAVDLHAGQPRRIGWRTEAVPMAAATVQAAVATEPKSSGLPGAPGLGQSSFFARPAVAVATAAAAPSPTVSAQSEALKAPPAPPKPTPAAIIRGPDWRSSALDRFKKMPDLGKRPTK